ncbi:MAG TPA: septal ring lytic transglycosylase RlpA family protein [Candidatus Binatia bacterium]
MVVAAVAHSMTRQQSYKAAAISAFHGLVLPSRVRTWFFAAVMMVIAQTWSGVSEAADETPAEILSENVVSEETQLEAISGETSVPENVDEVSDVKEPEIPALMATPSPVEAGIASWYGARHHGRRTASGERFDQKKLTAAHPTLPWGSIVRVTSLANGKSVDVRINDRGPFVKGRIIDLSRAAARALGMAGLMQVQLEVLTPAEISANRELVLDEQRQATAQAPNQN